MARSERELAQRKLSQAAGLCDNIDQHLLFIHELYKEPVPDIAVMTEQLHDILTLLKELILELKGKF